MKPSTHQLISGFHAAGSRFMRDRYCRFTRHVLSHEVKYERQMLLNDHMETIREQGRKFLREHHIDMAQILNAKPMQVMED